MAGSNLSLNPGNDRESDQQNRPGPFLRFYEVGPYLLDGYFGRASKLIFYI